MNPTGKHLLLILLSPALAITPLSAQEKMEIKYLAPDAATVAQIKSSLALDQSTPKETMEIYFFDTPSLTLLKDQHLALRLRKKGKTWTFTVKERPTPLQPGEAGTNAKIETDESIAHLEKVRSCSIDSKPSTASIKAALKSDSIAGLLSLSQKDFFKKQLHQIAWDQVRCFPKIQSRRWTLPDSKTLDAESWQYPGGEVLEISYKSEAKDPAIAEKNFTTWLTAHSINSADGKGMKTSTVLETLTKQLTPK